MSIEAMKQALEALQRCGYHKLQPDSIQNIVNHYIPLLEQAIATEESSATQEPVAWRNAAIRVGEDLCSVGPFGYYDMTAKQWLDWALSVVTVHAPTQPKAEQDNEFKNFHRQLCERLNYFHDEKYWKRDQDSLIEWIANQIEPKAEQEPVKIIEYNCKCGRTMKFESEHGVIAPKREWVGLTDEDRLNLCKQFPLSLTYNQINAIEAKFKEKNT